MIDRSSLFNVSREDKERIFRFGGAEALEAAAPHGGLFLSAGRS